MKREYYVHFALSLLKKTNGYMNNKIIYKWTNNQMCSRNNNYLYITYHIICSYLHGFFFFPEYFLIGLIEIYLIKANFKTSNLIRCTFQNHVFIHILSVYNITET